MSAMLEDAWEPAAARAAPASLSSQRFGRCIHCAVKASFYFPVLAAAPLDTSVLHTVEEPRARCLNVATPRFSHPLS
jgi:hypothetical protein